MDRSRLIASALIVLLTTSCAGFRGTELPPVTAWPPSPAGAGAAGGEKPSVSVVVVGNLTFNGAQKDVPPAALKLWTERVESVYRSSNLFSSVERGLGETDLRAEVSITDRGEGSLVLAFLTGLTLYVIPSSATDTFVVSTKFFASDGSEKGTVDKQGSSTLWQQIFLLPLTPFRFPLAVGNQVFDDVHRATLLAADTQGLLE